MYIETVPNRGSPPAILLRESYRDDGKVRKRTLLNLCDWPRARDRRPARVLKGGTRHSRRHRTALPITRTLPHGHVAAVLGTLRRIGLDRLLGPAGTRCRDLVVAMMVGRMIEPVSKLATARALDRPRPPPASAACSAWARSTRTSSTRRSTGCWSASRRSRPHWPDAICSNGTLVLYDVSSSYLEGRCCPLASAATTVTASSGTLQIVYGLLCAPDGCPVAIEVFDGNTGDPTTLARRSTSSSSASASPMWCWSAIAA